MRSRIKRIKAIKVKPNGLPHRAEALRDVYGATETTTRRHEGIEWSEGAEGIDHSQSGETGEARGFGEAEKGCGANRIKVNQSDLARPETGEQVCSALPLPVFILDLWFGWILLSRTWPMPGRIWMSRKKFKEMHERGGTFDACAEPPRERGFCRYRMSVDATMMIPGRGVLALLPTSTILLRLLPLCQFCSVH
jgi:hypothetical protein